MTTRNHGEALGRKRGRAGVTLLELLVVILIITLLATAATPVFINRIQEARLATARFEVEEIAKAQQLLALVHGVYVPIQVLDDLPFVPSGVVRDTGRDDIENETSGGSIFLIDITRNSEVMQLASGQTDLNLSNFTTDPIPQRVATGWKGPFLNPQRVWVGTDNVLDLNNDTEARFDHPLDPWGSPYRFFAPTGLIGSGASSLTRTSYSSNGFSDGRVTSNTDRFDRYAIVSLGPDGDFGAAGNASFVGDDVVYLFGIDPNESTFSF